ncbi:MAG: hypothetical protein ABSC19_20195, partial [Syntrophorhabdales bacterium]
GMKLVLIGFESIDVETLGQSISVTKKSWRKKHEKGVAKLRPSEPCGRVMSSSTRDFALS